MVIVPCRPTGCTLDTLGTSWHYSSSVFLKLLNLQSTPSSPTRRLPPLFKPPWSKCCESSSSALWDPTLGSKFPLTRLLAFSWYLHARICKKIEWDKIVTSCNSAKHLCFHAQLQLCNLRVRGTSVVAVPSSSLKAVTAPKVTWPRIAKKSRMRHFAFCQACCFQIQMESVWIVQDSIGVLQRGLSIFCPTARDSQDFNVCYVACVLLRTCQFKHLRPAIQSLVCRLWCHEVDGPRDRLLNQSYAEDCDTVRSHHVLTLKMDIKRCTQQTCPTSSNQSSSAKQKTE